MLQAHRVEKKYLYSLWLFFNKFVLCHVLMLIQTLIFQLIKIYEAKCISSVMFQKSQLLVSYLQLVVAIINNFYAIVVLQVRNFI